MIDITTVKCDNDTEAFKSALEQCPKGGSILVPAGHYTIDYLILKSYITIHLEAGAHIEFKPNKLTHPLVESRWEGQEELVYMPLIYGKDLSHVTLTGQGILSGSGDYWWSQLKSLEYSRPRFVCFEGCENITIEGLTFKNSPAWTINPIRCNNITIDKITIWNPKDSPNTDGINPDSCSNVRISNCHINTGDDCITLKSGTENSKYNLACENITIVNCTLLHGHGGIVFGSEMSGGIKRVVVSNCIMDGTDRGLRFKSRRGRGGSVEDISISNIVMNNVICPIVFNHYYHCGLEGKSDTVKDKTYHEFDTSTPTFKHINLSNISARQVTGAAGFFYGLPESHIEDISLSHISVSLIKHQPQQIAMLCDFPNHTQAGFILKHTSNIRFFDVHVENHKGQLYDIEDSNHIRY